MATFAALTTRRTAESTNASAKPVASRKLAQPLIRPHIHGRLAISRPSDPQEQEAERIAAVVAAGGRASPSGTASSLQRACSECEEEQVQRACSGCEAEDEETKDADDDEAVMRSPAGTGAGPVVKPRTAAAISAMRASGGASLGRGLREYFEPRLGADLSRVRIHTGAGAAAASRDLRARAFTVGHDVFFPNDGWRAGTRAGRELLAHELVHTVQQGDAVLRRAPAEVAASTEATPERYELEAVPAVVNLNEDEDNLGNATGLYARSNMMSASEGAPMSVISDDVLLIRLVRVGETDNEHVRGIAWGGSPELRFKEAGMGVVQVRIPTVKRARRLNIEAIFDGTARRIRFDVDVAPRTATTPTPDYTGRQWELCGAPCPKSTHETLTSVLGGATRAIGSALSKLRSMSLEDLSDPVGTAFRNAFFGGSRLIPKHRLAHAVYKSECASKPWGKERRQCRREATRDARMATAKWVHTRVVDVLTVARNHLQHPVSFTCPKAANCCPNQVGAFIDKLGRPLVIQICPRFFGNPRHNLIHEIMHTAGVTAIIPQGAEKYHHQEDWSGLGHHRWIHMADAYALFVDEAGA